MVVKSQASTLIVATAWGLENGIEERGWADKQSPKTRLSPFCAACRLSSRRLMAENPVPKIWASEQSAFSRAMEFHRHLMSVSQWIAIFSSLSIPCPSISSLVSAPNSRFAGQEASCGVVLEKGLSGGSSPHIYLRLTRALSFIVFCFHRLYDTVLRSRVSP